MLWLQVTNRDGDWAILRAAMSAEDEAEAQRIFGTEFVAMAKSDLAIQDAELSAAKLVLTVSKAPREVGKDLDIEKEKEAVDGKEKR